MAQYVANATVNLTVNGRQANKILNDLKKDAQSLEQRIAAAAQAGDKVTMKKLQQQLNAVNRQIRTMTTESRSVEDALRNLDRASPKELRKTLNHLQRDLEKIERGSDAWNAQIEKIKAVKAQLSQVNSELSLQESKFSKFNRWLNDCQTLLMGVVAALTGLVMAGRKAVNAYAEMEQEMANVRKFTGMSEDDVVKLNEELKKIDTRTSREDLNKLAQEAGRLGKTSQEDVLGFVRAADKINVALDDLGSGATLTLSKLTGIFGDEKRLGTEKALLAVGSVINELSQNCSASAPFLAEFASRMGGVGAQAGLTVQQIMGLAAVLDSNNQKVEASSTAISQIIVRIYQDPAKYARVAGIDVAKFASLVREDMNSALMLFLSTLNKAGKMDVLSPMFKDMGENGSRAISALSTLANNIDAVRSQQEVANMAFEQATSINNEFEVQNNTVMAGLDKAKNRLNEIAVTLGEKLQPVMKGMISSSTIALKGLTVIVDFIIKYKSEIIAVTAAIVGYNVVLLLYNTHTVIAAKATALFQGALAIAKGVIPAIRILLVPLINTVQYFTNGLQVNYAMQQRWRASLQAMKFSSWIGLFAALAGAVYIFTKRLSESRKAAREAQEAYSRMEAKAAEDTAAEIKNIDLLYKKTQDGNLAQEERIKAIERLRNMYPDYFRDISNEAILAGKAAHAYNDLKNSILESAKAKGRESMISTLEGEIQQLKKSYQDEAREWILIKQKLSARYMSRPGDLKNDPEYRLAEHNLKIIESRYKPSIDQKQKMQDSLAEENAAWQTDSRDKSSEEDSNDGSGDGYVPSSSNNDKFSAEKQWREMQEAFARIRYATGESDYVTHTQRMQEIELEYYRRLLDHTDLSEMERLNLTAQYREAQLKQSKQVTADSIAEENSIYSEGMMELKQFYIDGMISKAAFDKASEEAEIQHQKNLVFLTVDGTAERLRAEQQLQSLLLNQMQRRQKEQEQLESKYASMKSQFFGDNPAEAQEKYDADLNLLQVVYDREIAAAGDNAAERLRIEEAFEAAKLALKRKYNLISEEEMKSSMQRMVDDSIEWLNSDGGKALKGSLDTLVSGMSSIFSGISSLVQSDLEIQTAAINKRYDAEIERASGNKTRIAQLEKQKEAEIAKAKSEANKKMFAMQVIQAVAQTATNALNAYGSAAAIPVVGYILAPVAAAMAVAAGAVQIAAIKKQQQASEAQGYQQGGFTRKGRADEPAGIVHAGEWVASKKLVDSPAFRPAINFMEYAQRNNKVASFSMDAVSARLSAPMAAAAVPKQIIAVPVPAVDDDGDSALNMSLRSLDKTVVMLQRRMDMPMITVNSVTGDQGILEAEDKYKQLIRNKTPRYKR